MSHRRMNRGAKAGAFSRHSPRPFSIADNEYPVCPARLGQVRWLTLFHPQLGSIRVVHGWILRALD